MNTNKAIGILQAVKAGTADAFIRKAAIKDALDMAISALEKQEQIVDASCETCKYKNRSGNTYPCFGCFRASDQDDYYEPYTEEEARRKEKQ